MIATRWYRYTSIGFKRNTFWIYVASRGLSSADALIVHRCRERPLVKRFLLEVLKLLNGWRISSCFPRASCCIIPSEELVIAAYYIRDLSAGLGSDLLINFELLSEKFIPAIETRLVANEYEKN